MLNNILEAASKLHGDGFSVIPVSKETKAPLISGWKEYQKKPPTLGEIKKWFSTVNEDTCIAVIGGKVSKNIEFLDFDVEGELYDTWRKKVKKSKPKLFKKLIIETTQNSGFHVIYCCPKITIPSSDKLAYLKIEKDGSGIHLYKGKQFVAKEINGAYFILPIAIETRGEPSYCIVAPSPGYEFIQNDLTFLPKITPKERDLLINTARLFNEYVPPSKIKYSSLGKRKEGVSRKPWEDYNERGDSESILKKHGWEKTGNRSSKYQYYRRPGKNKGVSASFIDGKVFHCFSTNAAPFEGGETYSPSGVYALLEHGGDFKKGTKALASQGYGTSKPSPTDIDVSGLKKLSELFLESQDSCESFNPSKLPPLLKKYIKTKSKETNADPIMITQSILCSLSAIIGKRIYIPEGKYFQRLFPILWTLSISSSGQFKTTALHKGTDIARRLRKKIQDKIDKKRDYLETVKDSDDRIFIEGQIHEIEKFIPILPEKSTAEGMLHYISDKNGGMVVCSEFGEWAENLNRTYNNGYQSLLTNIFDVPEMVENITKGEGLMTIKEPFITINAVSTLTWVEKHINTSDVSSGFFARFLLFFPPENNQIPRALPKKMKNANTKFVKEIEHNLKSIKSIEFKLTKKAKKKFKKFHKKMYQDFNKQPEKTFELLSPYLKRWSPYILKIAMLLQVIDDPKSTKIKKKSIVGAKSIVDYAIKSTVYLFKNDLGESDQQRKKRKILQYMARKKGKVLRGQLIRSKVLQGSVVEYDGVLNTLIAEGSIDVDKSATIQYDWVYILISQI